MLLNRKDVQECLAKITETAVLKYGLDPNEIVEKVKDVAYVDPAMLVDPKTGACYENMHDIPIEARRAIKKFVVENLYEKDHNGINVCIGRVVKVEMWDRLKAAEMLGREVNLFKETVVQQHDVTGNMKDILLESRKRAEERQLASGAAVPKLIESKRK
jgi:predicted DNA-binding helix-hairpin-helix protein